MLKRLIGGSLRQRLIVFLSLPLLMVLGVSVISDYREGLRVANEAYDQALASTAIALAARMDHDDSDALLDLNASAETVRQADKLDKVSFGMADEAGKCLSGDCALLKDASARQTKNPAFHSIDRHGSTQRVATYRFRSQADQPHEAVIVVAETTHKRERAATHIMNNALRSNILLIATTLAIVFFGIRHALSPLDALGARIARRAPSDLRAIGSAGVPTEARPLVAAIDLLMAHLREASAAQQAFVSNAAHQLRTPLADLQTQLELACATPTQIDRTRLDHLRQAAARLSHLTHQMLALARATPEAGLAAELQDIYLPDLLEDAASHFIDAAIGRTIDLGFEAQSAWVHGSRWMLRELLSNLIDNALRYVPNGGNVTVRCGLNTDGEGYLEVEDDGPGIPAAEREKVLTRFYRLPNSPAGGSGLGLAIVGEIAARHEGSLQLAGSTIEGCGLRVTVSFPAPLEPNVPASYPAVGV